MKGIKIDLKNSFRKIRPYFIPFIILLTVLSTAVYLWGDFKNIRSGLNMSHRSKLEDMGLDCTDCHTVKEDNPRFMTFPDHETCSMCHFDAVDETSADKDCSLCHNKPGNKVNTRKDMVLSPLVIFDHNNHQKNGEVACLECHDKILTEYDVEDPDATLPAAVMRILSDGFFDKLNPFWHNQNPCPSYTNILICGVTCIIEPCPPTLSQSLLNQLLLPSHPILQTS